MDVIYATLIIKGLRTYESVPAKIKERVKQVLINGRKQTFERILKSKAAKVFGTAGAAPDSDVAELVVEHPLSECLHVDFVME